eukprot:4215847-Amphidinium_carterae.1
MEKTKNGKWAFLKKIPFDLCGSGTQDLGYHVDVGFVVCLQKVLQSLHAWDLSTFPCFLQVVLDALQAEHRASSMRTKMLETVYLHFIGGTIC